MIPTEDTHRMKLSLTAGAIEALIDDRPDDGVFQLDRRIFRDPEIFELEMEHIFEGTWVFVGLSSQVPNPHDFLTTVIGRQPVVVMRDADGRLNCFINSCRHRGALICHLRRGNKKIHVCNYHSWSYDTAGRNVGIKGRKDGGYSAAFDRDSHDLVAVPRFAEYRGFLFASLRADVPDLGEHLGEARVYIDLLVDQSPDGLEVIPGDVIYTYRGNWKLQLENCTDSYHFTSTHPSYLQLLSRRAEARDRAERVVTAWEDNESWETGGKIGSFAFAHGHCAVWAGQPQSVNSPLFHSLSSLVERVGAVRARWMFNQRNLTLFPNFQIAENASVQLRVMRPLSVDETEMQTFCIAPVGEPPESRRQRIRQYEDFFNPSGLATPDDNTVYEDCQTGYASRLIDWQHGYMRGMTLRRDGADPAAAELGIQPVSSMTGTFDNCDETLFHSPYREWRRLITAALRRNEGANGAVQS
jgi:benzoate/toluate 1,2-dioxygenase alpha subunit